MKQSIPTPIAAIVVVLVVAIVGFLLYRNYAAPSYGTSSPAGAHLTPPPLNAKKPDFSKMTPDQINAMKQGGMAGVLRGGTPK
jgi:hypothetical protein